MALDVDKGEPMQTKTYVENYEQIALNCDRELGLYHHMPTRSVTKLRHAADVTPEGREARRRYLEMEAEFTEARCQVRARETRREELGAWRGLFYGTLFLAVLAATLWGLCLLAQSLQQSHPEILRWLQERD